MELQIHSVSLLVITALLGSQCVNGSCPEDMYIVDTICCRLCPEGTFLKTPCNVSRGNSQCEPCPASTYMDKRNNKTECEACTKCGPSGQIVLEECKPKKNRECGCGDGKYHDPAYLFCMDCLKCPTGEGVVSPCTSNTKCQPCPKGTFSDKESFEQQCMSCSKCEPAGLMVVKEECIVSRDTICRRSRNVSLNVMTPSRSFATVTLTPAPTSGGAKLQPISKEKSDGYKYIIPIISVSFVIFVLVVAMVCFFVRRRGDTNETSRAPDETEMSEYHFPVPAITLETPAQTRSSHGLRGRRTPYTRSSSSSQRQDSDSQGSNGSLQSVSVGNVKNKVLVRDLPGHIFIDLGRLLNPKSFNNWVTLAGLLGFTNSHVKNFELDLEVATQTLLHEWGQREGSTVDVLTDVLRDMKRDDCVQVLKQWDS